MPVCFSSAAISLIANALNLNACGKIIPSAVGETFFKLNTLAKAESTSLTVPILIGVSNPIFLVLCLII